MRTGRVGNGSLLLPGLIWVAAFTTLPLIYAVYLSFTDAQIIRPAAFVGLQNYTSLLGDSRALSSIGLTLTLALGSLALTLGFGVFSAWLFSYDLPGIRTMRVLLTTPLFVAPVAAASIGGLLFNINYGLINRLLSLVGIGPVPWLGSPGVAPVSVMLIDAWQWTPLVFIVMLTAIRSIPAEAYETVRLETTSEWAIFRHIVFPRIRPILVTVALLRLLEALKMLDIPYTLTRGGPGSSTQTLPLAVYLQSAQALRVGYGSALALVLLLLCVPVIGLLIRRLYAHLEAARGAN